MFNFTKKSNDTCEGKASLHTQVNSSEKASPKASELMNKALLSAEAGNYKATIVSLKQAYDLGDPMATCILADCHFYGAGVQENMATAVNLYNLSAKLGYPRAYFVLGYLYEHGLGVSKNRSSSNKYYQIAMNSGYSKSALFGELLKTNKHKDYLWDLALAGHGIASCQCNVGVGFYTGELSPVPNPHYLKPVELKKKRYEQAYKWFALASQGNEPSAFYNMYLMIQSKHIKNISMDLAIEYLKKSAELGYPQAQYSLGNKYFRGKSGLKRSLSEATRLFTLSSEGGCAIATHRLGACYFYGRGVEIDYPSAFYYFRKATESGYSPSICHLGYCYLKGLGVAPDPKKGFSYFVEALSKKITNAHAYLGDCYFEGLGVAKSYHSAFSHYLSAYKCGILAVGERLAYCYENGLGTRKNPLEAKRIRASISQRSCPDGADTTSGAMSYDTVALDDTTEVITRVRPRSTK